MQEEAFNVRVRTRVDEMVREFGADATDHARANLLKALDEGDPDVAFVYEVCLRLIERQSREPVAIPALGIEPRQKSWLHRWLSPGLPAKRMTGEPAV